MQKMMKRSRITINNEEDEKGKMIKITNVNDAKENNDQNQ
jgi:hypothetical protein